MEECRAESRISIGVVRPGGYLSVRLAESQSPFWWRAIWHPRSTATMPQLSRLDRVRGCLLGMAVGDALGAPLEGLSSQQIRAHYGLVVDYVDGARAWKKKPYRWRLPGLYSDDTQQALVLSDVVLEHGRIDTARLAELYLQLATPEGGYAGAHRGVGRSFRQVLADLKRGVSPDRTGQG